ncbi:MAG: hypothetical protein ACYTG0_02920 [Planctomycetota bacterium]|jgi:hypothetical protein
MLEEYSDRICTYFKVDYEPQFGTNLAEAADMIQKQFSPPRSGLGAPRGFGFSWPSERYLLTLDFRGIAWQSLGLHQWSDHREKHVKTIQAALDTLGVSELTRIGFKVSAYLPLDMSHQELCDLMFGSFLASADEWVDEWGRIIDPGLHLEGERNGFGYIAILSALNTAQIATVFRQHKNLELFVEDKFLDTGIKDFQQRIAAADCFFFDVDLFRNTVNVDALGGFIQDSLIEADQLADWSVRRLRSQPIAEGERDG